MAELIGRAAALKDRLSRRELPMPTHITDLAQSSKRFLTAIETGGTHWDTVARHVVDASLDERRRASFTTAFRTTVTANPEMDKATAFAHAFATWVPDVVFPYATPEQQGIKDDLQALVLSTASLSGNEVPVGEKGPLVIDGSIDGTTIHLTSEYKTTTIRPDYDGTVTNGSTTWTLSNEDATKLHDALSFVFQASYPYRELIIDQS